VTRDVAGSAFQYAKIMTLPFFGSGIVELPPEGFKRAKNSRKMQMVFFVHQGKVLVTVGPPALENGGAGNDAETNEFAISKGGVWVVPRGMSPNCSFPFCISSQQPVRARTGSHNATLAGISLQPGFRRRAVRQVCQLIF
jgi:hypothetical protein